MWGDNFLALIYLTRTFILVLNNSFFSAIDLNMLPIVDMEYANTPHTNKATTTTYTLSMSVYGVISPYPIVNVVITLK